MSGQGFNFGGEKAQELKRRIAECRRNPDYARALFGLRPKGLRREPVPVEEDRKR